MACKGDPAKTGAATIKLMKKSQRPLDLPGAREKFTQVADLSTDEATNQHCRQFEQVREQLTPA
jgi:hypothetical protein